MVRPIETIEKELRECREGASAAETNVVTATTGKLVNKVATKMATVTLAATISTFAVAPYAYAVGSATHGAAAMESAEDECDGTSDVLSHSASEKGDKLTGSLSDEGAESPFEAARDAQAFDGLPIPVISEDLTLAAEAPGFSTFATKYCGVICNYGIDQSKYDVNNVYKSYLEGEAIQFPTPEKAMEGVDPAEWKFTGWFTAPTGGTMVADANSTPITSLLASKTEVEYYAQYEYVGTYNITFSYEFAEGVGAGATVPPSTTIQVNVNNAIGNAVPTPPAAPAGAKFGGWFGSDGKAVDPRYVVVRGDMTFVGRYVDDTVVMHSVTFVWGKEGIGTGIHTNQPVEFAENTAVTFPTATEVSIGTNYELVGWYTQANGAGTKVADANGVPVTGTAGASLAADATFYAHYKYVGTYTVQMKFMLDSSAQAAAPAGTKAPATRTYKIRAEHTIGKSMPTVTAIDGCTFLGWYATDASGNPTGNPMTDEQLSACTVTGDVTYVGVYTAAEKTKYSVVFNWGRAYAPENGAPATDKHSSTVTVEEGQTLAAVGGIPTDTQVSLSGYTFLGWFDSAGKQLNTSAAVTANGAYTAKYEKIPCYDITFRWGRAYVGGDGADPMDAQASKCSVEKGKTLASATVPSDAQVAVSGYKFLGWYDASGNKLNTGSAVQSAQVFTAKYEKVATPIGPVDPDPGTDPDPVDPGVDPEPGPDPKPDVPTPAPTPTPTPSVDSGDAGAGASIAPAGQASTRNPRNPFTPWNPPGLAVAAGFTVPAAGPGVEVFDELPEPVVSGAGAGDGDKPYEEDSLPAGVSLFDAETLDGSALPFSSADLVTVAALAGGAAMVALIASKVSSLLGANALAAANMRARRPKGKRSLNSERKRRRKALGLE